MTAPDRIGERYETVIELEQGHRISLDGVMTEWHGWRLKWRKEGTRLRWRKVLLDDEPPLGNELQALCAQLTEGRRG